MRARLDNSLIQSETPLSTKACSIVSRVIRVQARETMRELHVPWYAAGDNNRMQTERAT